MRLLVHVEGQTEESFVNEVLGPYLIGHGYESVSARLLGNSRMRTHRGGISAWHAVRTDICNHLRQDAGAVATTMVDYYGMPADSWPGRAAANGLQFERKASCVEEAIHADLTAQMGYAVNPDRFIPYVAMHEFEGLLFSDCKGLAEGVGMAALEHRFVEVRNAFETPEHINDSVATAPSKRIQGIHPGYQKVLHGPMAAVFVGLDSIRAQCAGFDRWIHRLVGLVA